MCVCHILSIKFQQNIFQGRGQKGAKFVIFNFASSIVSLAGT